MEDKQIVELFWQRSEEALAALDHKYGKLCRALASRWAKDPQDAEECVNDAYLALWEAIPPARPEPLIAYLCKVIRNLSLKRREHDEAMKRDSRCDASLEELAEALPAGTDVWSEVAAKELARALERFLDTLSRQDRVIFMRRYWFGDPYQEIAGRVGLSEKTVSVRLTRLRKRLRQYFIQEGILS